MPTQSDTALAHSWLAAIARPEVARSLEHIYTSVAQEITARAPACWASGRCCNFAKAGHRLYVTGLEAAYALHHHTPPRSTLSLPQLTSPLPICPFLDGTLCGIHTIKPLACRTYFCDTTARDWQEALTERALADIRALHDHAAVEYRYAEWGAMLAILRAAPPPNQKSDVEN